MTTSPLDPRYVLLDLPVFPIILTGHALYIALSNRSLDPTKQLHWLLSALMTLVRTIGGSSLTLLLLGLPISHLANNTTIPTILGVWYLVYHSPGDIVHTLLSTQPCKTILYVLEAISSYRSVSSGVARAVEHLPGSWVGALVLGTLSGCGGSLLAAMEWRFRGISRVSELSRPSWLIKSCFLSALVIYFGTGPSPLSEFVDPIHIRQLLATFLVARFVLAALFLPFEAWNVFAPIENAFYTVSRISPPDSRAHVVLLAEDLRQHNLNGGEKDVEVGPEDKGKQKQS